MGKSTTVCALRPATQGDAWAINRRVFASSLHPAAKVVLLVVLDHARHGKSRCTASNATLARESNVGVRQVISHVGKLVRDGWLDLERLGPTINHGRVLTMGAVCKAVQTPSAIRRTPPLPRGADPLCGPGQTNGPERAGEKGACGRPSAVETDGHLPAMERFFSRLIPESVKLPPADTCVRMT